MFIDKETDITIIDEAFQAYTDIERKINYGRLVNNNRSFEIHDRTFETKLTCLENIVVEVEIKVKFPHSQHTDYVIEVKEKQTGIILARGIKHSSFNSLNSNYSHSLFFTMDDEFDAYTIINSSLTEIDFKDIFKFQEISKSYKNKINSSIYRNKFDNEFKAILALNLDIIKILLETDFNKYLDAMESRSYKFEYKKVLNTSYYPITSLDCIGTVIEIQYTLNEKGILEIVAIDCYGEKIINNEYSFKQIIAYSDFIERYLYFKNNSYITDQDLTSKVINEAMNIIIDDHFENNIIKTPLDSLENNLDDYYIIWSYLYSKNEIFLKVRDVDNKVILRVSINYKINTDIDIL